MCKQNYTCTSTSNFYAGNKKVLAGKVYPVLRLKSAYKTVNIIQIS